MDEGERIAYGVLEKGVPVHASGGEQVGTVHHVVADGRRDIFHGIVIATHDGQRFVEAAYVGELHERGVDLSIDREAAAQLPRPGGGAPVYVEDPAEATAWHHWVRKVTLRKDWNKEE